MDFKDGSNDLVIPIILLEPCWGMLHIRFAGGRSDSNRFIYCYAVKELPLITPALDPDDDLFDLLSEVRILPVVILQLVQFSKNSRQQKKHETVISRRCPYTELDQVCQLLRSCRESELSR